MTSRTFKQAGIAYGRTPVTITVKIDDNTIYSGPVKTIDDIIPSFPDPNWTSTNYLFTWQNDVEFSGTQFLEINVGWGDLLLAETTANYGFIIDPKDPLYKIPNGPDNFVGFCTERVSDPLSDVTIDGIPQPRDDSLLGQWHWMIPAGSTFTAKINIPSGSNLYDDNKKF